MNVTELYKIACDKTYVITGELALWECGLIIDTPYELSVLTDHNLFRQVYIRGRIRYNYIQHVDTKNYVKPHKQFPNILVPTQERALVDIIQADFDYTDEGAFCMAMEQYCNTHNYQLDALYEVADFYFVPREVIDHWVSESKGSIQ